MRWGRKAILLDLVKNLGCINAKYLSKPKSFVVSDKKQEAKSGSTKSSYWLIVDDEKKYHLQRTNAPTHQHPSSRDTSRGRPWNFHTVQMHPLRGAQSQPSQFPRQDEGTSFWADPRTYGLFSALHQLHRVPPLQNEAGIPSKRSRGRVSSKAKTHFFINQSPSLIQLPNHKRLKNFAYWRAPATSQHYPYKSENYFFPPYKDNKEYIPLRKPEVSFNDAYVRTNASVSECNTVASNQYHTSYWFIEQPRKKTII